MSKNEITRMENSELLANLLMSRDNLVTITNAMCDNKEVDLEDLFQKEQEHYNEYLKEVYWRMNHGKR